MSTTVHHFRIHLLLLLLLLLLPVFRVSFFRHLRLKEPRLATTRVSTNPEK